MDRSGSGPQGQSGGRRLSLRPDLRPCPLPADSGYLFSGSRPPSQGSRAGELPVPGEETTEARGGQEAASGGSSVWAGSPEPSWGGTGGGGGRVGGSLGSHRSLTVVKSQRRASSCAALGTWPPPRASVSSSAKWVCSF